eukprot:9100161-Heterocapsa_arctica.AAC.1
MWDKPTERKLLSHYGAVRLSKEEALDVIQRESRPGNFWILMVTYEERSEKRIGYIFYQDYGNQECASWLDSKEYSTETSWSLLGFSEKTKGDIVET